MGQVNEILRAHGAPCLAQMGHGRPLHAVLCGSAGDGKTSLIGGLAAACGGGSGNARDFSAGQRRFLVADLPGHEQHTQPLVAAASAADLAIVVVDALQGLRAQVRRHSLLLAQTGIGPLVLAVNKMDLVGYSQAAFEEITDGFRSFAAQIGLGEVVAIPVSALQGDNLLRPSLRMDWYGGPSLGQHLEEAAFGPDRLRAGPLRMPLQTVERPAQSAPGYAGTLASGSIRQGDHVRVSPTGVQSQVLRITTVDGDVAQAVAPQSVVLALAGAPEIAPGDVIAAADAPAPAARQFEVTVVWLGEQAMLSGRDYLMKTGSSTVTACVMPLKYKLDASTGQRLASASLVRYEIGVVDLALERAIAFDPFAHHRETGAFLLLDPLSHETVGTGMIRHSLRRSDDIHWQAAAVTKASRRRMNQHGSAVVWLTGLSGAGKSTLANLLEQRLHAQGKRTYLLDGDNVRHGLTKDLGFTAADRVENIRRVAEVAKLFVDAGLIVLTAFISPFRSERRMARELMAQGEFIEVFVDTPLAVAESRDPKGLYKKARRGDLKNFTGIDSPYEAPESPELRVDTSCCTPEEAVDMIYRHLAAAGVLDAH
ncbi:adenylyl-sulfate kinase [Delftia sp. PS-11]|uniref:adenylyl-sulfate kinase n=1 Tax=Delftia sp. PS-11 TaxID=2767222 RepID=UPI00245430D6|nr:adenylyl-sulfate kinase [Delftia sp. PS-11]KAJ8744942.1 adenylyl-sulfate kinase [Delftia sp. PS-11]